MVSSTWGPEQGQYPHQGQWTCRGASRVDTPQQQDGISCGVFAITFATLILMQIPLRHFSQNLVPRMRLHVANCILSQACPLPACVNEMGNRKNRPANGYFTPNAESFVDFSLGYFFHFLSCSIIIINIQPQFRDSSVSPLFQTENSVCDEFRSS